MQIIVRDKRFYRSLVALAVPICLQNILTYGVALADNVMVGQLGETALGGLYVGTVVHMVLMNILFGVTHASTILTA
jgi:Na+-driven multidrug efflux pump